MQMRIVLRAFLRHRERVVGLTDGDEAPGGGGIVLVVVWVVLLGQRIELFLDLLCVRRGRDLESFIVVRSAIGETGRRRVEETSVRTTRATSACPSPLGAHKGPDEEGRAGWHCPFRVTRECVGEERPECKMNWRV